MVGKRAVTFGGKIEFISARLPTLRHGKTNMVGKRAVKSGCEIEFISARLPTLRDIPSIRFITSHKGMAFQIPRRLWRCISANQIQAA